MKTGDKVKIKSKYWLSSDDVGVVESIQHKYFTALVSWPLGRKYHKLDDLTVIKNKNVD